jgi:hypothetical protein
MGTDGERLVAGEVERLRRPDVVDHVVARQTGALSDHMRRAPAVIESTNVDGAGNGTIRILSQNDTTDGWRTLSVNNWSVNGPAAGLGATTGWLHKP